MSDTFAVQAKTALSPEWDRGFDDAFADLVSSDPDLVRSEFDALIGACWDEPPAPPPPSARPVPSAARPTPPPGKSVDADTTPGRSDDQAPTETDSSQRSPP
jgi:hypothetical protein